MATTNINEIKINNFMDAIDYCNAFCRIAHHSEPDVMLSIIAMMIEEVASVSKTPMVEILDALKRFKGEIDEQMGDYESPYVEHGRAEEVSD